MEALMGPPSLISIGALPKRLRGKSHTMRPTRSQPGADLSPAGDRKRQAMMKQDQIQQPLLVGRVSRAGRAQRQIDQAARGAGSQPPGHREHHGRSLVHAELHAEPAFVQHRVLHGSGWPDHSVLVATKANLADQRRPCLLRKAHSHPASCLVRESMLRATRRLDEGFRMAPIHRDYNHGAQWQKSTWSTSVPCGSGSKVAAHAPMHPLRLIDSAPGEYSLLLDAGTTQVDDVIEELGHTPNGYFWEGIARLLVSTEAPPWKTGSPTTPKATCSARTEKTAARWRSWAPGWRPPRQTPTACGGSSQPPRRTVSSSTTDPSAAEQQTVTPPPSGRAQFDLRPSRRQSAERPAACENVAGWCLHLHHCGH